MINTIDVQLSVEPIEGLQRSVAEFNTVIERVVQETFEQTKPQLLELLRFYPPKPPNSTYRRTFRLKKSWYANLLISGDDVSIYIGNTAPYASDVVGALARNLNTARQFQQVFHSNNGWPLAQRTIDDWLDDFIAKVERGLRNIDITAQGSRR